MSPELLAAIDRENKLTSGAVERYIYLNFMERQSTVAAIIEKIEEAVKRPIDFQLDELLSFFVSEPGIRRSIDKAYEIVTYGLFETIVRGLEAEVTVSVPERNRGLLEEFADLARVLLNVGGEQTQWTLPARIHRVGVTNAADRGLDMWANFGPAIQVKHLTLDKELANEIIDQIESDNIVVVCRDADEQTIEAVIKQIGWGRRVRGIVTESELILWYERCLRGKYSEKLARPLMELLENGFRMEFPQAAEIAEFFEERGYTNITPPQMWRTKSDRLIRDTE